MNRITALSLCAVLAASGCKPGSAVTAGQLRDAWSQVSDRSYIRTRGIGAAPAGVSSRTRRRAAARNAALVAARYEMLAVIKGVRVTGGLSVAELMAGKLPPILDSLDRGAPGRAA